MSRQKALLLGSTGQVGVELRRSFASYGNLIALDRTQADLTQIAPILARISTERPSVVLLAAAYTAVDKAESEPALAMQVNSEPPGQIARLCAKLDILFVNYSTDYVFDGTKREPWLESDTPNPLNVYGLSKLEGERRVQQAGGRHLIFRTSWVYGPHGKNFLLTMLRLGRECAELNVVDDQIGSPTSSAAIADASRAIVDRMATKSASKAGAASGIYHLTCAGSTNWRGFARNIFARANDLIEGRAPKVNGLSSEQYPTPAARPKYSVMSNRKLALSFDVELPSWENALEVVIEQLRHR